jgi:hypothetical protein
MDSFSNLLGGSGGAKNGLAEVGFSAAASKAGMFDNNCCNLSKKHRVMGFVGCFLIGMLLSFLVSGGQTRRESGAGQARGGAADCLTPSKWERKMQQVRPRCAARHW